jgi:hypothetical protein
MIVTNGPPPMPAPIRSDPVGIVEPYPRRSAGGRPQNACIYDTVRALRPWLDTAHAELDNDTLCDLELRPIKHQKDFEFIEHHDGLAR